MSEFGNLENEAEQFAVKEGEQELQNKFHMGGGQQGQQDQYGQGQQSQDQYGQGQQDQYGQGQQDQYGYGQGQQDQYGQGQDEYGQGQQDQGQQDQYGGDQQSGLTSWLDMRPPAAWERGDLQPPGHQPPWPASPGRSFVPWLGSGVARPEAAARGEIPVSVRSNAVRPGFHGVSPGSGLCHMAS